MEKDDTSSKLAAVLNLLSGNPDDKQLKAKITEKLTKDKQDEERKTRYKQKERLYQAVPIVIDGFTMDGTKSLVKTLKIALDGMFNVDVKKPEVKFPWLRMILSLLAFAAGLIIGFIVGAIKSIKDWGSLIKKLATSLGKNILGAFERLRKSKLGELIEDFFSKIKGKFVKLIERIKKTKTGKMIEEIFDTLKSKFTNILEEIKQFKPTEFIKSKFTKITKAIEEVFNGIKTAIKENIIVTTISKVFTSIGEFFKPLTDLLPKMQGVKPFKILEPIFSFFDDIFKLVSGPFKAGLAIGKTLGRALGPIFAIFEVFIGLYESFTDPKLKDKSFLQKAVTGVVKGIIEFFTGITKLIGLDLFNFDEIRDRIDKIFSGFKKGFLPGIMQLINQLVSTITSIPMKIVGWIVGWFDKDAGNKIKELGRNFDYLETLKKLWNSIKEVVGLAFDWFKSIFTWDNIKSSLINAKDFYVNKFKSIADGFKDVVSRIIDWLKSLFTWENLKNLFLNATPAGLAIKAGQYVGKKIKGAVSNESASQPTPVGDFIDDNQRVMYSKRGSYSFDKNDQIVAMKKGGPIESALKTFDNKTSKSMDSVKKTLEALGKRLETHFSKTEKFYDAEYKLLTANNQALLQLKDAPHPSSNVVVNNSSNNTVFSQRTTSNNEYRFDLAGKAYAY
jgi:hypothetical protein